MTLTMTVSSDVLAGPLVIEWYAHTGSHNTVVRWPEGTRTTLCTETPSEALRYALTTLLGEIVP